MSGFFNSNYIFRVAAAILATLGAGTALALWAMTIPDASGWSSWEGSSLLLFILALALLGLFAGLLALRRPDLVGILLIVPGAFHFVYPWAFPGMAMLCAAALCGLNRLWEQTPSNQAGAKSNG